MTTLLLTLGLDAAAAAHFERLRQRHFPATLNRVPAHVMLFHHLPIEREAEICAALGALAATVMPFAMTVCAPRSIGRGVSYDLLSPELLHARATLAQRYRAELTAQDLETYRPHIVVQNKVDPKLARATLATLTADFEPFTAHGVGLILWTYRDGSWENPKEFAFGADA